MAATAVPAPDSAGTIICVGFSIFLLFRHQWVWAGAVLVFAAYVTAVSLRAIFGWTMITSAGVTTPRLIGRRFIELTTTRLLKKRGLPVPRKLYLGRDPGYDRVVARIHRTWAVQTDRPPSGHARRIVRHYGQGGFRFPWTTED